MALIDKETICAEIKRLIEINKTKRGFPAGTYCAIRIDAYEHLLNFIDTIPEQPVTDYHDLEQGLEEEIDKYCQPIQAWEVQEAPFTSLEECARHFAEWGAENLKR